MDLGLGGAAPSLSLSLSIPWPPCERPGRANANAHAVEDGEPAQRYDSRPT